MIFGSWRSTRRNLADSPVPRKLTKVSRAVGFLLPLLVSSCTTVRSSLIAVAADFEPKKPGIAEETLTPSYTGRDSKRKNIPVKLTLVASGLKGPTDVMPVPGEKNLLLILGKNGDAHLVNTADGSKKKLFSLEVSTSAEQGLLGVAFHPKFATSRRLFLNYSPNGSNSLNRVAEWTWPKDGVPREARILLDVEDPYPNHNGGQLVFGPDGYLYIGHGDGGWMGDPEGNGQDLGALLGKMLRIDVDSGASASRPYGIPNDNPFLSRKGARPEIWAYGLRNPWRYSFSSKGRLVVADVGQSSEEEVTYLAAGDNAGWKVMEGFSCYEPKSGCKKKGKRTPITSYGRDDGFSITGGYEVLASTVPELKNLYVFGDYAKGRIWAMPLPDGDAKISRDDLTSLGQFPLTISTFGRDHEGRVYVAGFDQGAIYRIHPSK